MRKTNYILLLLFCLPVLFSHAKINNNNTTIPGRNICPVPALIIDNNNRTSGKLNDLQYNSDYFSYRSKALMRVDTQKKSAVENQKLNKITFKSIIIISQPDSLINVCAGSIAKFVVAGTGITGYQWQVSSDGGLTFNDLAEGAGYSGTLADTLSVNVVISMDSVLLRCRITDGAATLESNPALLTIDKIAPEIICPASMVVCQEDGENGAHVIFSNPTGTDNCQGSVTTQSAGLPSGSLFPVGTTTNTFVVTDVSGTTAACSFNITVKQAPFDVSSRDGLIAYYPFNDNANDESGYGNNGTLYGPVPVADRYSVANSAYNFDGINDYILINDPVPPALQIQNEITLSAWIYAANHPGSGNLWLIAGSQCDACGSSGASIFLDGRTNSDGQTCPPGHIHFQIGDGSWHVSNTKTQVPLNQWVYVVATRKANEDAKIYYNGVQQPLTSVPWSGAISYSGAYFAIGRQRDYNNRFFTGIIDEVRVYNRALSESDVNDLYRNMLVYASDDSICPNTSVDISLTNSEPGVSYQLKKEGINDGYSQPGNGGTLVFNSGILNTGSSFTIEATDTSTGCSKVLDTTILIVVSDLHPPLIFCPANINRTADPGGCSILVAIPNITTTDNCPGVSISGLRNDASALNEPYPVGITTITWKATDGYGNTAVCNQTVTVTDNEPPQINCPGDIVVNNEHGLCSAVVRFPSLTATDNCGVVSIVTQTFEYMGSTAYWVAPQNGIYTIDVYGAEGGSQSIWAGGKGARMKGDFALHAGDIFTILVGQKGFNGPDNGNWFLGGGGGGGSYVVRNGQLLIAAGGGGGAGCGEYGINGIPGADNNFGIFGFDGNPGVDSTDGTDANGNWPVGANGIPGSNGNGGTGGVFYAGGGGGGYLTDGSNSVDGSIANGGTSFLNGGYGGTSQGYVITPGAKGGYGGGGGANSGGGGGGGYSGGAGGHHGANYSATGGGGGGSYNTGSNQVNASGVRTGNGVVAISWNTYLEPPVVQNSGLPSGSEFFIGTTTNEFITTDAAGNTDICSFNVIVNDNEQPGIKCEDNIVQAADYGQCTSNVSIINPAVSDNCPGAYFTGVRSDSAALNDPYPVGSTTITWTATDGAGNTAFCLQTVTITDNEFPEIACPENIIATPVSGSCYATVNFTVNYSDNCPGAFLTLNSGLASGSMFPAGVTNQVFYVTDASGNTSGCIFSVTIQDHVLPVIICPANIHQTADSGQCSALLSITSAQASDNCAGVVVSASRSDAAALGDPYPVGTTIITWRATDINGNFAICTQTITITDDELPVISCPENININSVTGICGAPVTFTVNFSDNCSGPLLYMDYGLSSGSVFPVGISNQIYHVTDASGNSASCGFTVYVHDVEMPVITCPENSVYPSDSGQCSALLSLTNATATDNCAELTITGVRSDLATLTDPYPVGTTIITWIVTDIVGNSSICNQTITVVDYEIPTITCPADISIGKPPAICGAVVNYTVAYTDNCPGSALYLDQGLANGSLFPVGVTTQVYHVSDASGNSASCSFTITVRDPVAPVITCPGDISQNIISGQCSTSIAIINATATDNCSAVVTGARNDGKMLSEQYPIGTTVITWTAVDISGNTATCTQLVVVHSEVEITVQPVSPPEICAGGSFQDISIGTGGNPQSLLFQWYVSPVNNTNSGTPVYGADTSVLTPPVTPAGTVYYYCVVGATGSACADTSIVVAATVVNDPVWDVYSVTPDILCPGGYVSLSAGVIGGTGGNISWIRATVPGGAGDEVLSPYLESAAGTYYYRPHYQPAGSGCNLTDGPETAVFVSPSVGTPVFVLGGNSSIIQGSGPITYTANASNASGIIYSLDVASINGGNAINPAIGEVTYNPSWWGTTVITATASGCNGPATAQHTVTIDTGNNTISGKTKYLGRANVGVPVPAQPTYNPVVYNINKVIVKLKSYPAGNELARDTSDINGNFIFTYVPDGTYLLSYDKYTPDTMQMGNDVSAIDVALVKYFIGADSISDPSRNFSWGYKKAANVDNNAGINAVDVARIKAKVGSPYSSARNFSKGNWVALDTVVTISGSNLNLTLKTICYGDFNASSTKYRDSLTSWTTAKSLPVNFIRQSDESVITNDHEYFEVPLRISTKINDFSALGLELNYPGSEFKLVSVSMPKTDDKNGPVKINPTMDEILTGDNDLLVTDEDGIIRVVYATTNHFDVDANDEMIRLGFRSINNLNQGQVEFTLNGPGVIGNMYGQEDENAYLIMPKIFVQGNDVDAGFDFTGYPNPFNSNVTLIYTVPDEGILKLNVYNGIGELVSTLEDGVQTGGNHTLMYSTESLAAGMYTFKLEYTGKERSTCMILKMIH